MSEAAPAPAGVHAELVEDYRDAHPDMNEAEARAESLTRMNYRALQRLCRKADAYPEDGRAKRRQLCASLGGAGVFSGPVGDARIYRKMDDGRVVVLEDDA